MEDELPKMIPTHGRSKIPRALSYVANAKMISLALQDVPQFDSLALTFACYDVAESLRHQQKPRSILGVTYRSHHINQFSSMEMERIGLYGPKWNVGVYVCRSEDAHEIRAWLLDIGLESARAWLHKVTIVPGESAYKYWQASFDEEDRTFSVAQT